MSKVQLKLLLETSLTDSDIEIELTLGSLSFTIADGASLKATMTAATNRGCVPADENKKDDAPGNIGCRFTHTSESQLPSWTLPV